MIIRKLKISDLKDIVIIAKALPKWFTPKGVKGIRRACKVQDGYVAIHANNVIGFLLYRKWKSTADIKWMGILTNYHRKGIGKRLVQSLENHLEKSKITKIKVSTVAPSVKYEPYNKTRKFYKGVGFKNYRIDKDFYKDEKKKSDRLVLLKQI